MVVYTSARTTLSALQVDQPSLVKAGSDKDTKVEVGYNCNNLYPMYGPGPRNTHRSTAMRP
jgi:hypothetical protein